jgi:hypothetical protein
MAQKRPISVLIVAAIAILFGFGEIYVSLFGNYLGILSRSIQPSAITAIVGAFYSLGGLFLLITPRKWGTILSLIFIGAEVVGRVYLVTAGLAPSSGDDFFKIVIGGIIAVAFMLYIGLRSL